MRSIIDVPRPLMQVTQVDWDIDWGGQSAGGDMGGGDQHVVSAFPRFMGRPAFRLQGEALAQWRALRSRVQGRVNALRLRMIDPLSCQENAVGSEADFFAWRNGLYIEARPRVPAVGPISAGAAQIVIDETGLTFGPVRVGAYMSYGDWPFIVQGRSGSGASVTLDVAMLRTAIPDGGLIDVYARGIFLFDDPLAGAAAYGRVPRSTFELSVSEWITR